MNVVNHKIFLLVSAVFLSGCATSEKSVDTRTAYGSYIGEVVLETIPNSSDSYLQNKVTFAEQSGILWHVEEGVKTDCASIPELAWPFLGEPCTEEFKAPAVVHDRYANEELRDERIPFRTVHDMFYFALMANGVDKLKARTMWAAVRFFGPRWEPVGDEAQWLTQHSREYLKSGGKLFFVSSNKNTSVNIELRADSTKLVDQNFDTEWFAKYVGWLKKTIDAPFAVVQSAADTCDSIANDAPTGAVPAFISDTKTVDGVSGKHNPASFQIATAYNTIKNLEANERRELSSNAFAAGEGPEDAFHRLGNGIGNVFHCPNLEDPGKTFNHSR